MTDGNGAVDRCDLVGVRRLPGAFTLLELLTVIAIVAMLIAILVPTIKGALSVTRTAKCGSNLRELSKAVANLRADNPTEKLFAQTWQSALKPYVGDNLDVYVCPEYAGDNPGATEIALSDIVYFRVVHGRTDVVELTENPYVLKLSDPQFQAARSHVPELLGNSNASNNFPRAEWPYHDDGTGTYWLCMEDYGNDWDFKDVMTRVTDNYDGTLSLYMISGFTGHQNSLRWKHDDSLIASIPSNTTVGVEVTLPTEEYQSSYGMNGKAEAIKFSGAKVLMIDYLWIVASRTHDWSVHPGPTPGVPIFARHMGKMNVLLSGGEVLLMRPEEIDPADPLVQSYRWDKDPPK